MDDTTRRRAFERWAREASLDVYDGRAGEGYLRHLVVREGAHTGQILAMLVTTAGTLLAADWRSDYNANHPHSALGMMPPARFAASWQRIGNTNGSINPGLSHGVDR